MNNKIKWWFTIFAFVLSFHTHACNPIANPLIQFKDELNRIVQN